MSIIIRLQNLPWSANSVDIRRFFSGLSIPEGGVHIVGGEMGDAFIAFSTDEDARLAMEKNGGKIKDMQIKLLLSSRTEMMRVIEQARQQNIVAIQPAPVVVSQPQLNSSQQPARIITPTSEPERRRGRSPSPRRHSRDRSPPRERRRSPDDRRLSKRDRSRSPSRSHRSFSRDMDRRSDRFKRDDRRYDDSRYRDEKRFGRDSSHEPKRYPDADHVNSRSQLHSTGGFRNTQPFYEQQNAAATSLYSYGNQQPAARGFPEQYGQTPSHLPQPQQFTPQKPMDFPPIANQQPPLSSAYPQEEHFKPPVPTSGVGSVPTLEQPVAKSRRRTRFDPEVVPTQAPSHFTTTDAKASVENQQDQFFKNVNMAPNVSAMPYSETRNNWPSEAVARSNTSAWNEKHPGLINPPVSKNGDFVQVVPMDLDSPSEMSPEKETYETILARGPPSFAPRNEDLRRDGHNRGLSTFNEIQQHREPENRQERVPGLHFENRGLIMPDRGPGSHVENRGPPISDRGSVSHAENRGPPVTDRRPIPQSENRSSMMQERSPSTLHSENRGPPMQERSSMPLSENRGPPLRERGPLMQERAPMPHGENRGPPIQESGPMPHSETRGPPMQERDLVLHRENRGPVVQEKGTVPHGANRGPPIQERGPMSQVENRRLHIQNDTSRHIPSSLTVEVRGLPPDARIEDILDLFRGIPLPAANIRIEASDQGLEKSVIRFVSADDFEEAMNRNRRFVQEGRCELIPCPAAVFDSAAQSNKLRPKLKPHDEDLTVQLRGLPFSCKEDDVVHFFDGLGILDLYVDIAPDGRASGTGFVEFGTPEDFNAALGMNGKMIGHRYITVSVASKEMMAFARGEEINPRGPVPFHNNDHPPHHNANPGRPNQAKVPGPPGRPGASPMQRPPPCIAMKNLPEGVTNRDITGFLGQMNVMPRAVHIMLCPDKTPSGDAFAEFGAPEDLETALQLSGKPMLGNRVSVESISFHEMMDILGRPNPMAPVPAPMPLLRTPGEIERPRRPLLTQGPVERSRMEPPNRGMRPRMELYKGHREPGRPFGARMRGPWPRGSFNGGHRPDGRFSNPGPERIPKDFGAPGCVVSINNLHFKAGLEELLDFFHDFNVTKDSVIRKYDENGRTTGEARVAFPNPREAQRAARELNHKPIMGRSLILSVL